MVPMTIDGQRELVNWMQRTLNMCLDSISSGRFCMHEVYTLCGTPACLLGHAYDALGEEYDAAKAGMEFSDVVDARLGFYQPVLFADFDGLDDEKLEAKYCKRNNTTWQLLYNACIDENATIRLWTSLLGHHRRRLATMEVEAGEWGPLSAKDAPVGRAREVAVQEKLEAVLV